MPRLGRTSAIFGKLAVDIGRNRCVDRLFLGGDCAELLGFGGRAGCREQPK
jgi:hypothetical protein